jgi:FkbM family methyltransferase
MSQTAEGLTKFGYPSVQSLVEAFRSEFENWLALGALSWLALPTRCPPRSGWPRLKRRTVDVRLRNGFRARCRLDEFSGFVEVWVYREYEVPGLAWQSVKTVIDVGANVGAATLWFASRAAVAQVVAVEPSAAVLQSLRENVRANRLAARVTIFPVALGPSRGTGYLQATGMSTTATVRADPGGGSSAVPILSLGDLIEEAKIGEVDVLKLDCEGAEFEILRSTEPSVLRSVRAIVGEFHASHGQRRDLEHALIRSGFDCRFQGREDFGLFSAVRRETHGGR